MCCLVAYIVRGKLLQILYMQKIGILLPRSTYYSSIGFDLFEGLQSGLQHLKRNDTTVVCDNIGFGTDQQQCYRIAESMLLQDGVSVVFAYISHKTAQLLRPLFLASNKVLIVLDSGANLPHEWPESSNTLFHSLHNSLGSWLSAGEATEQGHNKAAMVTGYYDGGYLHTYATYLGFTAGGGNIAYNHATGYTRTDFSMEKLKHWFSEQSETCLLSPFSGDFVQWYFEELNLHFSSLYPEVFMPPFGMEEMMLSETRFPDHNIQGIAAWYKNNPRKENQEFCTALTQKGKTPNLFSLLGWEASILGIKAIDLMAENNHNGKEVCGQLLNYSFESPRGHVFFHAPTKTTLSSMYQSVIKPDNTEHCALKIIRELPTELILDTYENMVNTPLENAISGWHNSYTCI